jgi:dihydrofolate synthase/folylpolyglutamate synthase
MRLTQDADLNTWLAYIAQRHTPEIILGLERIEVIAQRLHLDNFDCPVITVAGTNGKGSTVAVLQNLYSSAGYRVGSYYSPHLHHFTERVMINNKSVNEVALCQAFGEIEAASTGIPITFFEFITLAALLLFKNSALDVIILEVGLGGRLDAVNCVNNDIAILTQVAFDHCERLGNDRESIGAEKAGIFRKNAKAICGDPNPPHTVSDYAKKLSCDFFSLGKEFNYVQQGQYWSWWSGAVHYADLPRPQVPITSAACALMACHLLAERLAINPQHIFSAVKNTSLPGRFQVVQATCPIIFDVAHNPAAANFLAEQLSHFHNNSIGNTYAIFSLLADKDLDGVIAPMVGIVDEWHVIQLSTERAAKSADITQRITGFFNQPCYNHAEVATMWQILGEKLQPLDRVVVFGSFYTVAAVQEEMKIRADSSCESLTFLG